MSMMPAAPGPGTSQRRRPIALGSTLLVVLLLGGLVLFGSGRPTLAIEPAEFSPATAAQLRRAIRSWQWAEIGRALAHGEVRSAIAQVRWIVTVNHFRITSDDRENIIGELGWRDRAGTRVTVTLSLVRQPQRCEVSSAAW